MLGDVVPSQGRTVMARTRGCRGGRRHARSVDPYRPLPAGGARAVRTLCGSSLSGSRGTSPPTGDDMGQADDDQRRLVLDQFTRQAEPFARLPAHSTEESVRLVREAAGIDPADTILDVACGPGLLACAFARSARHVTGIDLTPAMIDQA